MVTELTPSLTVTSAVTSPLVRTRTDGPALNDALSATGRLLAAHSLLLAAGVLLS